MTSGTAVRRCLVGVWLASMAVDVVCSLLPRLELPGAMWNADKLYHGAAYAWLGGLAVLAVPGRTAGRLAALSMIVLGALLEWGQSFVPGRTASLGDAAANAVGVLLGLWLATRWKGGKTPRRGESFPPDPLNGGGDGVPSPSQSVIKRIPKGEALWPPEAFFPPK